MPITFRCTCGKLMQAKDEYAGKKVKCGGCGAIVMIPAAPPAPTAPSAPTSPSAFSAETMPYAGPSSAATVPPPFQSRESVQAGRPPAPPPAASPGRPLRDDDDWDRRPPRKRRGMALWLKLTIVFVVVGLVGAGGWFLVRLLRGGGPGSAQLAMVPRDAAAFGTVRVSELWNSKSMEKVRTDFGPKVEAALKEEIGLGIADIDRATFVIADIPFDGPAVPEAWAIIHTKVAIDQDKVAKLIIPDKTEHTAGGKKYYTSPKARNVALHFASDKEVWIGADSVIPRLLDGSRKIATSGGLSDSVGVAATNKHHLVMAFQMPEDLRRKLKTERIPPEAAPFREFVSAVVAFNADEGGAIDYRLRFTKAEAARDAETLVRTSIEKLRREAPHLRGEEAMMFAMVEKMLNNVTLKTSGTELVVSVAGGGEALAATIGMLLPAVQKVRFAAGRTVATNNMRQLVLAMHAHHDTYKYLPPSRMDKVANGLSWRVKLLPFLEQDHLYREFRLDEPWNSPHNIKLLERMPDVYKPVGGPEAKPGHTPYQVVRGEGLIFHKMFDRKSRLHTIPDGTSNTFLIVEANRLVPWTAPDDIDYQPIIPGFGLPPGVKGGPMPPLGYQIPGEFLVGMGDGVARWVPATIDQRTFDLYVHPSDGHPIPDLDALIFKK